MTRRARRLGKDHGRPTQRQRRQLAVASRVFGRAERGGREQCFCECRRSRRSCAVDRIAWPCHQCFGVVRSVEPAAGILGIREVLDRDVEHLLRACKPLELTGRLMQCEKPRHEPCVVLEHAGGIADHAAERRSSEPAVDDMFGKKVAGAACGSSDPLRSAQCCTGFRERGDRHAVPRRHNLVVTPWLWTGIAFSQKYFPNAVEPLGIGRIVEQLQDRAAMFECACRNHRENTCGPRPIVRAENSGELVRRPHVGRSLDAFGIGIERRREAPLFGQQLGE